MPTPPTRTVLLTGFAPFAGEKVNSSWLAARRLHGRVIRGHRVVARRLPTEFGRSAETLLRHLRRLQPRLVICVGQAGGRAEITPERVAVNLVDARIPDNAGRRPREQAVVAGGPAAFWSTLPVRAIVRALRCQGVPAAVSLSAGTFVCNEVFYRLMQELAPGGGARGGFIHVPYLPAQAARHRGKPSLPLERMVEGLEIAVRTALERRGR